MNTTNSRKQLKKLISSLPSADEILQGSLNVYYNVCKNSPNCICHKGHKHGPYWYLSIQRNGTKKVLIPKNKLLFVRKYLRNWKKHFKLIHKIMDVNLEIIKKEG